MKITEIKTFLMHGGNRNWVFCKVETDEGVHGWGEGTLERHEEAVTQASEQQDRGEDWSRFSAAGEATEIPQGVEEIAAETKADEARQDGEQKDREEVNVGDLMKQMSIQSGIIKS